MSSEWRPPTELPDLRRAGIIALDTETKDEGLLANRGSSWPWGDGFVCGISIAYHANDAIRAHYFSLRHPDSPNFDRKQLIAWLRELIASGVRIVTQNGLYDFGWLRADFGIEMPLSERLEEIGALATIVDENRYKYGLDALCAWRGLVGKDEALLKEAAIAHGFPKKVKPQAYIWQLPARFVGPYAEVRRRQHARTVREPQSDTQPREHPRRLSARSRPPSNGARDASARNPHRCCGGGVRA